jgi:Domain of unknown function (DUF4157)
VKAPPQARTVEGRQTAAPHSASARKAADKSAFADNRPAAVAQLKLVESIDTSPHLVAQRMRLGSRSGEAIAPLQRESPPARNNTGLPDKLKSGVESLSGLSLDNVRVHYNSSQPAQLSALAYAQGADIHVAPGQERHLPHEAWHVVQQAQGRVRPTMEAKGVAINDDTRLEAEADTLGGRAGQMKMAPARPIAPATFPSGTTAQLTPDRIKGALRALRLMRQRRNRDLAEKEDTEEREQLYEGTSGEESELTVLDQVSSVIGEEDTSGEGKYWRPASSADKSVRKFIPEKVSDKEWKAPVNPLSEQEQALYMKRVGGSIAIGLGEDTQDWYKTGGEREGEYETAKGDFVPWKRIPGRFDQPNISRKEFLHLSEPELVRSEDWRGQFQQSGLTLAQWTALRVYTSRDYKLINPVLVGSAEWLAAVHPESRSYMARSEQYRRTLAEEGKTHADMIMDALAQLGSTPGTVYRGERCTPNGFIEKYGDSENLGKIIEQKEIKSTTKDEDIALPFADGATTTDPNKTWSVMNTIELHAGYDVSNISVVDEAEMITPPGTKYKVTAIRDDNRNSPGSPKADRWLRVYLEQQ